MLNKADNTFSKLPVLIMFYDGFYGGFRRTVKNM